MVRGSSTREKMHCSANCFNEFTHASHRNERSFPKGVSPDTRVNNVVYDEAAHMQ